MKLYYMPGACSLATLILLNEAKATFDLERVNRDKTTTSGENFLEVNPKGYVPALKLDDGDVVSENIVVHALVADMYPDANLAPPRGTKARLKYDELAVFITTEIHKTYSPLFNPALSDETKAVFRDNLRKRYAMVEQKLSDGRPYLTGPDFTGADAYLFTVTTWAKGRELDLSGFPNVLAFQKRVADRPAVQAAFEAEGIKH